MLGIGCGGYSFFSLVTIDSENVSVIMVDINAVGLRIVFLGVSLRTSNSARGIHGEYDCCDQGNAAYRTKQEVFSRRFFRFGHVIK